MQLEQIQSALSEAGFDGWLFFDHHRRDPLAYRILQLPDYVSVTRRWYYLIPTFGDPQKLVHKIENATLDSLPGSKFIYASWIELQGRLADLLQGKQKIAMQYSPNCSIPSVSLVDAGTYESIRALNVHIFSSADLVQTFDSLLTAEQIKTHNEAAEKVDAVRHEAFNLISERTRAGVKVMEFDVQQFMRTRFDDLGLCTDHGPIVAVNENASDPHYEPQKERQAEIKRGDLVLIDCWAKMNKSGSVYYDVTWTGFCGDSVPEAINQVFDIVRGARRAACQLVIERVSAKTPLAGFEVDDAARGYITGRGYGEFFVHRTGHNIGEDIHGTGANMDNLESHDDRRILAGSCFSIEPGIYLPKFGIRSEVNMVVERDRAFITGEEQEKLLLI